MKLSTSLINKTRKCACITSAVLATVLSFGLGGLWYVDNTNDYAMAFAIVFGLVAILLFWFYNVFESNCN